MPVLDVEEYHVVVKSSLFLLSVDQLAYLMHEDGIYTLLLLMSHVVLRLGLLDASSIRVIYKMHIAVSHSLSLEFESRLKLHLFLLCNSSDFYSWTTGLACWLISSVRVIYKMHSTVSQFFLRGV